MFSLRKIKKVPILSLLPYIKKYNELYGGVIMTKNSVRTKMSVRNAGATMTNRIVTMALNFFARTVFIRTLGTDYLGLGGLFGNIFSMISLCELGFGAAFTQSLYKPIAENNEKQVCAVMNYFTHIYNMIAAVSAVLAVAVMPFLDKIVKNTTEIPGIYSIYVLFTLHNTVSFLLAPKRTLIICDQKMYVVSNIRTVFSVLIFVCQVAVLEMTGNYILYLSSRIVLLTLEAVTVNIYADKRYKFLSGKNTVDKAYKDSLFAKVRALMLHKTGSVLTHSTDSILISYFLGLSCMGKYSNYALIVGSIVTLIDIAIGAVSSSVGNLGATADRATNERVMRRIGFVNFWLLTVCSCVLLTCLNPVIELWIGKDMLFSMPEVAVIVASFYFSCIRDPVQSFINAYGIFEPSKYMNLARASVNLILSVVFVKNFGIAGVFMGTVLSVIAVPLWCEPHVLYKYGFKMSAHDFSLEFLGYLACTAGICFVCVALTNNFPVTLAWTICRGAVSLLVSGVLAAVIYCKNSLFKEVCEMLLRALKFS